MKTKSAYLILALTLITAPLLPGTASADGGRNWDGNSRWEQRGHHDDRGHHGRDWGRHGHDKGLHGKGYRGPTVAYRDHPVWYGPSWDGLTIIYNGRWH